MRLLATLMSILLLGPLLGSGVSRAEDEVTPGPWQFEMLAGLNLNQSAFSNNWSGGDRGSYAWAIKSDLRAERQFTRAFNWTNTLSLAYGITAKQVPKPDKPQEKVWDHPQKSDDQILLESTARWGQTSLNPYLQFRFETQFLDKSDPRGAFNFNPLRFNEVAGITKVFEKTEKREILTRLGFSLRENVAKTFQDLAGDQTTTSSTMDGGSEWQSIAGFPFSKERFTLNSRLVLFLPVFYSAKSDLKAFDQDRIDAGIPGDAVADYWKVPSADWQNTLTAKITDLMSVNLFFQLVYEKFDSSTNLNPDLPLDVRAANADVGIRKAAQWKQTLALSLSYRFF
ncbi:MAG TPA: DUF3078 domain-containing protein [Candidatus Krumholzibacteria bacterium]|nr:DUF3078 domain-containing protein [Candidatus Krumholzibacteria bacterium]